MASILIVDYDPAVRTTVALLLERSGYRTQVAADGRAGLAALAAGGVDMLIVDLFMPGMDGIETIREVRKHQPELPIIVMSGTVLDAASPGAPNFLAMAIKLGAVRSIQKPFKPRDILRTIEDLLGHETSSQRCGARA